MITEKELSYLLFMVSVQIVAGMFVFIFLDKALGLIFLTFTFSVLFIFKHQEKYHRKEWIKKEKKKED